MVRVKTFKALRSTRLTASWTLRCMSARSIPTRLSWRNWRIVCGVRSVSRLKQPVRKAGRIDVVFADVRVEQDLSW